MGIPPAQLAAEALRFSYDDVEPSAWFRVRGLVSTIHPCCLLGTVVVTGAARL